MPADIADAGLAHAASRFPERADAIRRLARANCEFRELCIEYELALEGLARFEALSDAGERPEVDG